MGSDFFFFMQFLQGEPNYLPNDNHNGFCNIKKGVQRYRPGQLRGGVIRTASAVDFAADCKRFHFRHIYAVCIFFNAYFSAYHP